MTSARSMTRTLSSRSRFAPWVGVSSSSKMTSVAFKSAHGLAHFLDLALADQESRCGRLDLLGDAPDDLGAGGVDQSGQFIEMLVHELRTSRVPLRGAATSSARSTGSRTSIMVRMA